VKFFALLLCAAIAFEQKAWRACSAVKQFAQPILLDRLFRTFRAAVQPVLDRLRHERIDPHVLV